MKAIRILAGAFGSALLLGAIFFSPHTPIAVHANSVTEPQTDADASLSRGRSLLKQGHADQALPLLDTALNFYTQANNPRGIAAARDALGDLYLLQGQFTVALDHYQKAYEAFVAANA